MAFKDGYRLEKVYFENIYTLLNTLKSMKGSEVNFDTIKELLDNAIADNESIIIIYKNLGELYSEVSIKFTEIDKELKDLRNTLEEWKDEINDKIDEVNNYIMTFIREILQRLDVIEADLAQMGRVLTYDITRVEGEWTLNEQNTAVTFAQTVSYFTHERPHLVLVRGELYGEEIYLFPRKYDTNNSTGIFEWYSMRFVGNEIHEVTVTLLPDNSVNVAVQTTDFATINQRLSKAESDIDALEGRMDTAEDDIDNLEQTTENHNERITNLETCCDDMQENVIPQIQTTLAGKQDALTAGNGILLSNNVISADTDVLQEKLTAGSGISIDPNTNEISASGGGSNFLPTRDYVNKSLTGGIYNSGDRRIRYISYSTRLGNEIKGFNVTIPWADFTQLKAALAAHNITTPTMLVFSYYMSIGSDSSTAGNTTLTEEISREFYYFDGTQIAGVVNSIVGRCGITRSTGTGEAPAGSYMKVICVLSAFENVNVSSLTYAEMSQIFPTPELRVLT